MYRYRELLLSTLASAMLTSTLYPAPGEYAHASIVNANAARQVLESALAMSYGAGMPPAADYAPMTVEAPAAIMVVAGQPAAPLITPERMSALADYAHRRPQTMPLDVAVTDALRMTQGTPTTFRQINFSNAARTAVRAFAVNTAGGPTVLIYRVVNDQAWFYACDMRGELLASSRIENGTVIVQDIQSPAVRAAYENEISHWSNAVIPGLAPQA